LNTIHVHQSSEQGIFANAYIIETDNSVVVVDATLTMSESKKLRGRLNSLNKPIAGFLLTHAHPDHVAGLSNLVESSATPIYALRSVDKLMRALEAPKRAQWGPVFKQEWIQRWTYPNQLLEDGGAVTLAGNLFRVHDFGPGGDCDANSVWILDGKPRAAFIGDLVFNGIHSYIADNHITEWLANLARARVLLKGIDTVYPGHGDPGSLALLDRQTRYLETYASAVKELSHGKSSLTEDAKTELTSRMEAHLGGSKLNFLIAQSADPVAAELSRKK
jgi:glyoxylase-like metal-dependent hydrolase (beta-lactamase superfamily II)